MQKEINLKLLFEVIKKRLLLIFILTGITTAGGAFYSLVSQEPPPVYQSSVNLLFNGKQSIGTLEVILRDPAVLNTVIEELGINQTSDQLNSQITFANAEGSPIIQIIVQDNNPEQAAAIANSMANMFTQQVGNVFGVYDTKIITEAQISSTPLTVAEKPSLVKFAVIGLVGGLVLSIGAVFFLDTLDETIRSEREIEQLLDFPVLGSVSKMTRVNTISKPGQQKGLKKKR